MRNWAIAIAHKVKNIKWVIYGHRHQRIMHSEVASVRDDIQIWDAKSMYEYILHTWDLGVGLTTSDCRN
jgi:UDP-2,3-diacylglucosamine pyrophosphatase LpxH